ncbi:MAG: hypothetical protein K2N90_09280 [Lachnospiraceae bacterium]|nr:hypothetical protein [Lachnospiraceae bacterium]
MDKYEYKVRSEEIVKLIDKEKYAEAANVADTVDWRRVKSISMLLKIAALYSINRRNEDSRAILLLAYDKYPTNRSVVYSLCEISIELEDVVAAIEYYKQYAKIAPKDIGVIILHYRILEAQGASLEERIALLEELKKKDYQEEWALELADLYHRIGYATKCVEECDDIILWFGDGPNVMKAMELKQKHVPLTEIQQAKYENMLGNAQNNYSDQIYAENDNYTEEEYVKSDYNENGEYAGEESYTEDGYINDGYSNDGYSDDGYVDNSYVENGEYAGEETYAGNEYVNDSYREDSYGNNGYDNNENYPEESYAQNEYANEYYPEDYTNDDFYMEQVYDENNKPIIYEDGISSSYTNVVHEFPQPSSASVDMSQYNTINLQKVVAEGMMEIFSDSDDVFAEERENFSIEEEADVDKDDLHSEKNIEGVSENETVGNELIEKDTSNEEDLNEDLRGEISDEDILGENLMEEASEPESTYTDKVAMITSGISEETPAPDTGAIKKVIIPDENSRGIKAESNMDMLRDTTERSVNEEHARMERNAENVYHNTDLLNMETASEAAFQPMTGQMNISDVLSEWENIKLSNAKKHEEEIKQRVLTQTGKIFANFDNSLKSGVLGELEKEEAKAKDNFLVADVTGDIPETQANELSDEEYDVSYIAPGSNKQIITEIGAVVAKELAATRIIPQDDISREIAEAEHADTVAEELHEAVNDFEVNKPYDELNEYDNEWNEDYRGSEEIYDESDEVYHGTEEIYDESDEVYHGTEEIYDESNELYSESNEMHSEPDEVYDEVNEMYDDSNAYYDDSSETYNEYDSRAAYDENEDAGSDESEADMEDDPGAVRELDPEDAASIAETAKEDALRTQEIKMSTADLSSLSERIVETAKREATGARREEVREFTVEEQKLFENFAVTKKIKKQILYALENMTLAAFTGNVIITGDTGIDTVRMAKNLIREFQSEDSNFSGKVAKVTGQKLNQKNLKDVFEKLNNGGIIIEKANGMTEEKLYELATFLNQENLGIVVIMEDTKKEITKLLEKQAMIADYFNIRIDLMEMDNNALVAYARNYALALEYSIDELGILALYTRIANIQSGNHVVTKDEVREIIDEAIWKSKKSKIKNFVDVLFARRYDSEDMIVLKERDFM